MSNAGTQSMSVDEIQVAPPYAASGTYTSCPLDATAARYGRPPVGLTLFPQEPVWPFKRALRKTAQLGRAGPRFRPVGQYHLS